MNDGNEHGGERAARSLSETKGGKFKKRNEREFTTVVKWSEDSCKNICEGGIELLQFMRSSACNDGVRLSAIATREHLYTCSSLRRIRV